MEYGQFLVGLEPIFLGLDSSTISLNRDAFWSLSKNARRVLSSKYALADVAERYFDVEASFSVSINLGEGDGPVVEALKIDCVFRGHFHTSETLEPKHAQRFTDTESWLLFWPFFRQFVSDTTARMAIPPVFVPLALGPGEHSYRRTTPKAIEAKKRLKLPRKRAKTRPK